MSRFKFIKHKDQIVDWYKQGKTSAEIARLLNSTDVEVDAGCIRRLLHNTLGEIKNNSIKITPEIGQTIFNLLKEGKRTPEISKLLEINPVTINSYIRKHNIKLRPNRGNVHYFDIIDSYAKAYIVGFIAADGSLVTNSRTGSTTLTITVKYEDRAVLDFIKKEIGNENKLLEIKRPCSFNKDKIIHHIRYTLTDKSITEALNNLGIYNRKSLTIGNIVNNIPYKFRDAFIIGYFDGDGSVTTTDFTTKPNGTVCRNYSLYINIRGTKEFLSGICDHLNIDKSHIHQYDSIASLSFANKKDTYRLYQCYNNLPFYYIRKHDVFLTRINHPSYDKYKQDQTISSSSD